MVRNYKRKTEDRWSKEDLLEALTNIKEAKLKINDAARQYRISRATLYRQFKKFLQAGGKCDVNQFRTCGGNPILTKVEEDVLEKTIRDLREQGFTVTSSDIKRICFEYCDSNGIPNQFNQEKRMASDDWYYGFLKRHPDVRIGMDKDASDVRPLFGDGSSPPEPVSSPAKGRKKKKKGKQVEEEPKSPSRSTKSTVVTTPTKSSVKKNSKSKSPTPAPKKSPVKRKAGGKAKGRAKKAKIDMETVIVKQEEDILEGLADERDDEEEDDEMQTTENPETDASSKAEDDDDEEEVEEEEEEGEEDEDQDPEESQEQEEDGEEDEEEADGEGEGEDPEEDDEDDEEEEDE